MSRREIMKCLNRMINQDPVYAYKRGYLPYRLYNTFSTQNNCSRTSCHDANTQAQQQDPHYTQHQNHHNQHHIDHHNQLMENHRQRQRQYMREFDNFHRNFFNQLPLRRYAFHDEFSKLDSIFNQEFNRIRNSFFDPFSEEFEQSSGKQTTKQQEQQQQEQQQKHETAQKQEAQTNPKTSEAKESKDTSTQRNTSQDNLSKRDNFVDIDTFFESPKYIQDVHKLFEEEQSRLTKMMADFEKDVNKKIEEKDPNYHCIKSSYRRTPEGEYKEYFDSKNPEKNYKIEKKFEKPSLSSAQQQQQSQNTNTLNQKTEVKDTNQEQTQSQEQFNSQQEVTKQTTEQQQTQQTESNTENVQAANPEHQEKSEGVIDISPELNNKAKKLSLMLKKDYLECLELARVYPQKSVGQIIDMVIEGESFNSQHS